MTPVVLCRQFSRFLWVALVLLMFGTVGAGTATAQTQRNAPPLPPPLQNLADEGAQLRYLGTQFGMDGWIAIQGGQEQYFYVTPGGEGFVMGLLFDRNGRMQTVRQVSELQERSGVTLDLLARDDLVPANPAAQLTEDRTREFKTPAEQLFEDMTRSNWIPLGEDSAPAIYVFVDPQCPYCHALIQDMRANYIDNGRVQVRMIPVGFQSGSMEMSAFLLAAPNPQRRWYRFLDGDADAVPVAQDINQQGVQRNMAIMQSWKMNVTPLTVYRARDGSVKIVEGRIRDLPGLLADLPAPGGN